MCVSSEKETNNGITVRTFMGEQMAQRMCTNPAKMWITHTDKLCTICGYIVERYAQQYKA